MNDVLWVCFMGLDHGTWWSNRRWYTEPKFDGLWSHVHKLPHCDDNSLQVLFEGASLFTQKDFAFAIGRQIKQHQCGWLRFFHVFFIRLSGDVPMYSTPIVGLTLCSFFPTVWRVLFLLIIYIYYIYRDCKRGCKLPLNSYDWTSVSQQTWTPYVYIYVYT